MEKNSGRGFPSYIFKRKSLLNMWTYVCQQVECVKWKTKLHECANYSDGSLEIEHTLATNILREHKKTIWTSTCWIVGNRK